jgi:NADH-quinone oxidoreductase subunit L
MPITFATMMMGWLAICGIPFWAGFFSKDEILWRTWSTTALAVPETASKILWGIGAVTALLTAIYMTRMMVMTFWGEERFREAPAGGEADEAHAHGYDTSQVAHHAGSSSVDDRPHHAAGDTLTHPIEEEEHHHHGPVTPHESPWTMTVPLIVLAVLSTVGGLIGIPYALSSLTGLHIDNYFEKTLEPVLTNVPARSGSVADHAEASAEPTYLSPTPQPVDGASPLAVREAESSAEAAHVPSAEEMSKEREFTVLSVLIAAAGIIGGFLFFRKHPIFKMPRFLENKYYVDEIYDATIINPIKVGSREGLWKIFDLGVIDGIVNGLGRGISEIGSIARYIQIGFVRSYAAFILLGALVVVGYFVIRFIPLVR